MCACVCECVCVCVCSGRMALCVQKSHVEHQVSSGMRGEREEKRGKERRKRGKERRYEAKGDT